MKLPILLAAALGLLAPAAAQAQHWQAPPAPAPVPPPPPAELPYDPYFQPWYQREAPPAHEAPQIVRREGHTHLHVVPPDYGVVSVYDGQYLIARFDRPATATVPSGRWYRVFAQRGPETLWSGSIEATGDAITLRWPRDPYAEQRGYSAVLGPHEMRALLAAMDNQRDDDGRLALLREHTRRRFFTVAQADRILPRFRWDQGRVQALAEIRPRLVDPQRGERLLRHFTFKGARRDAAAILRGEPLRRDPRPLPRAPWPEPRGPRSLPRGHR